MKRLLNPSDRWPSVGSWAWLLLFGILGVGTLLYQPADSASSAIQLVSANPTIVAHSNSFHVAALGPHDVGRTIPTSLGATPSPQRRTYSTRNIEKIRVGDRVLAENPEITEAERAGWEEPNWASWLKLSLLMPKPDGSELQIQLLRPDSWFISQSRFVVAEPLFNCVIAPNEAANEEPTTTETSIPLRPVYRHFASQAALAESQGLQPVGFTVEMDLPELGLSGDAIVLDVEPSPPVDDGAGSVVTATFHHSSGDVIDLVVANDAGDRETIGTTSNHPFWSVDRHEYVQAGTLEPGELVLTYSGDTKRVTSKLARPGPQPVYNLEVHGEHVYFVGQDGILVHNNRSYLKREVETLESTGELVNMGAGARRGTVRYEWNYDGRKYLVDLDDQYRTVRMEGIWENVPDNVRSESLQRAFNRAVKGGESGPVSYAASHIFAREAGGPYRVPNFVKARRDWNSFGSWRKLEKLLNTDHVGANVVFNIHYRGPRSLIPKSVTVSGDSFRRVVKH